MKSRIISLSESEKRKITHASVSDNLLQRLPSFDSVSVDEIDELARENSFVKNLFGKVAADGEFLKSIGGLIIVGKPDSGKTNNGKKGKAHPSCLALCISYRGGCLWSLSLKS